MGLVGFLNFAMIKCFDHLAWPLLALGYPVCASIRAIETNSIYHMRKLVTYWIIFSLISLFELAFVKLIEWVPLWPYIKLGIVCWLVLPHFEGSHYCYKAFVHPCLSVNLEEAISWLYNRQEATIGKENFLSVAEKYVAENGTEALEKLIASKLDLLQSEGSRTDFGVEEIKAVAEADEKETTPTLKLDLLQSEGSRTDFGVEEIKAVAEADEKEMTPTLKQVKSVDPVLVEKTKTFAEVVKEMTVPAATGETLLPANAPLEKVQKEWTCALCQVTTTCEANLISHLRGMKHRAKCEELKAKTKQMAKNKAVQANQDSKNSICGVELSHNKVKRQEEKLKVKAKSEPEPDKQNTKSSSSSGMNHAKCWCQYCDVTCTSKIDFKSHLSGKKHLSRVQELAGSSAGLRFL